MKNVIIALTVISLCVQAQAQTHTLSTTDGATYNDITTQRVEPDGLYIEYTLPGGGIGMSKIKFDRLSRAQKKQFGFNAAHARDYEAEVAQANDDCSQQLNRRYEAERTARQQRDMENERLYDSRMAEMTRLNAANARSFLGHSAENPSWGAGLDYSAQFSNARVASQTSYGPVAADIFPNRGVTRSH